VFFGPLGYNSCTLIDYLESIPGTPKIKPLANPAAWMLGENFRAMGVVLDESGMKMSVREC
jgi:hypothetical protein